MREGEGGTEVLNPVGVPVRSTAEDEEELLLGYIQHVVQNDASDGG